MAEATYKYGPAAEQHATASGALASGEIIKLADDRAAVVAGLQAKASGDAYAVYTSGVFDVVSASAVEFAAGEAVYWDASENTAIVVGSAAVGDFVVGLAVEAKAAGALVVTVDLNAVGGTEKTQ